MNKFFICGNLKRLKPATGDYYGFPLCRPHFLYLLHQENKAEAWGNVPWKEVWSDARKDRKEEVELAINCMIIYRGNLRELPEEVYQIIATNKLDKKYKKYLP